MPNMGGMYQWMRKVLKAMDEQQLLELFHDLEDVEVVERIADTAYQFVERHEESHLSKWKRENLLSINGLNKRMNEEMRRIKSEDEENKEDDDRQRYRDIKSTNERPF